MEDHVLYKGNQNHPVGGMQYDNKGYDFDEDGLPTGKVCLATDTANSH